MGKGRPGNQSRMPWVNSAIGAARFQVRKHRLREANRYNGWWVPKRRSVKRHFPVIPSECQLPGVRWAAPATALRHPVSHIPRSLEYPPSSKCQTLTIRMSDVDCPTVRVVDVDQPTLPKLVCWPTLQRSLIFSICTFGAWVGIGTEDEPSRVV